MTMADYRMTDEELEELKKASRPVPYLIMGGMPPPSPRENAMRVWRKIAQRVGCVVDTIAPRGGDPHDFSATANPPPTGGEG
jgi:hypothetical protein